MVLLGIMGPIGSGKSTVANHLVKKHGFVEKSFAEPLKKACQELFLFTNDQMFGTQDQKMTPDERWFGCSPRTALQFVGTELLRDNLNTIMPGLGKNIFTHHFTIWYLNEIAKNPDIKVVVSDVRFQNEVNVIHSLGGSVIKITRDMTTTSTHASEVDMQSIMNFDHQVLNTSSLDNLYELVDTIVFY